jgi:hypothetical protein
MPKKCDQSKTHSEDHRSLEVQNALGDEHPYSDDDASVDDQQVDNGMIVRARDAQGELRASSKQETDPSKRATPQANQQNEGTER